jgi:hypothetical protein
MIHEHGQPRWNDIDRGKLKNSEKKNRPSATLSTTNPTRTNPDFRGQRPVSNRLSHATAYYHLTNILDDRYNERLNIYTPLQNLTHKCTPPF